MLGCLTQALLKMIFLFPTWDMLVPCRVTPLKWCKVCQVRWIRGLEMEAEFWRGKLSLNPEENVSLERLKRWLSTGEVPWTLPGDDLCHYLKDARRTGGWLTWQTYLCGFDSGQFDYVSFVSKPNKNQQKFSEVWFLLVAARCSLHTTNSEYWIRAFGTKAIAMWRSISEGHCSWWSCEILPEGLSEFLSFSC